AGSTLRGPRPQRHREAAPAARIPECHAQNDCAAMSECKAEGALLRAGLSRERNNSTFLSAGGPWIGWLQAIAGTGFRPPAQNQVYGNPIWHRICRRIPPLQVISRLRHLRSCTMSRVSEGTDYSTLGRAIRPCGHNAEGHALTRGG